MHWSRSSKTSWQSGLNPSVGEIIFALHLDQPRDGPLELRGAVPRDIDLCGRHLGRGDEQGARLVERSDQDVEALRRVGLARRQAWAPGDDKRGVAVGEREIVGGG